MSQTASFGFRPSVIEESTAKTDERSLKIAVAERTDPDRESESDQYGEHSLQHGVRNCPAENSVDPSENGFVDKVEAIGNLR